MERREFLEKIGVGAAFALTATCLGSCNTGGFGGAQQSPAPTSVNITLDLTLPQYAALKNDGGYIVTNGIVVARTIDGSYAAASARCTHQGGTVRYNQSADDWYCPVHGAQYNLTTGAGLNAYGRNGLKIYQTSLDGQKLTIS